MFFCGRWAVLLADARSHSQMRGRGGGASRVAGGKGRKRARAVSRRGWAVDSAMDGC